MSTAGTLVNKKRSGFVRTPPNLAVLIGKNILALPDEEFHVYDPTSGEGDFFYACAHARRARYFGSEISSERAAISRQRWPHATIVTSAFEAVSMQGKIQLLLCNAPYFFQNGKRAPYRIGADAGEWLQPGGVHVSIFTARSDWDGRMINHWLTWYDQVRVWKFPDRTSPEDERAFEDYTQICVVGVRRKTPATPTEAERKRLQGYQWKEPDRPGKSGWRYGFPPPELPTTPLADPYVVPASRQVPRLVVRNADEATLLGALDKSGAHLSPTWQQATTWPEEGYLGAPAMPYTGEAHIASEVMIGGLDGEIVWGPGSGSDAQPHLFTAFIGKEWMSMPVDDELKEKLREQGCVRVEMRQLMDKPILGVLNLESGRSRYYQGEEVFEFLKPWIPTLASRVIAKRKPLYRLDPADWEIRVLSQFGTDKRLPNAGHAGLAVAQLHRVFAMCRSLDVKGRTAIQGEPGTGKTRMATGTAKRQAYRWRHRNTEFLGTAQPAWVRGLRRAWLKNPLTLDMLGLEPVYGRRVKGNRSGKGRVALDSSTRQIIAYREKATGNLIAPEDAGPRALPVLITTPLKVTKEYGKEIQAAFPRSEVVHIESHRDIPRWLERCATSAKPVVFGIFSHSTTRAFGREWHEVVREKRVSVKEPVLDPPEDIMDLLEPVREERGRRQKIVGYRFKETGKLLTKEAQISYFYCPDCGGRIDAVPGKSNQADEEEDNKPKSGRTQQGSAAQAREKDDAAQDKTSPVTSRTWFTSRPRWCKCESSRRNQDRRERGKAPLRTALWQDDRTRVTNRKHPQVPFAAWSAAFSALQGSAQKALAGASSRELVERVRRDDALLVRLVRTALFDPHAAASVLELVERVDGEVAHLRQAEAEHTASLSALLLSAACRDEQFLDSLLREGMQRDGTLLEHCIQVAREHEVSLAGQLQANLEELCRAEEALTRQVALAVQTETDALSQVVRTLLEDTGASATFLEAALSHEPTWATTLEQWQRERNWRQLTHLLTKIAQRHDTLCAELVSAGMRDGELRSALLTQAGQNDPGVEQVVHAVGQQREDLLARVIEVARQQEDMARAIIGLAFLPADRFARLLVDLAVRDQRSLKNFIMGVEEREDKVAELAALIGECRERIAQRVEQAARRDGSHSILLRLVEETREQVDWQPVFFRLLFDQAHHSSSAQANGKKRAASTGSSLEDLAGRPAGRGVRLALATNGPITVEEVDRDAARGYDEVRDESGRVVGYQLGHQGKLLIPIYGRWSKRVTGYVDQQTGRVVTKKTCYDFRMPPAESFSPYEYLYAFYRGCVALAVIDESHNGRGRRTDIGHSHHFAMLAAQMRELTSGTHYGGDLIGFYHYWHRYHPQFWLSRGYGWNDAEKALSDYGVIQEWLKEYEREGDARRGSGKTDVYVSTVPAPGLSANLIPGLLEDLTYLTVLDVGAHMPPKQEIPKGISMKDPLLEQKKREAELEVTEARKQVGEIQVERTAMMQTPDGPVRQACLVQIDERLARAQARLNEVSEQAASTVQWVAERDLASAYARLVKSLEDLAREGNTAARLALGTIPRWFAALPCDSPYRVYHTERGDWGDKGEPELVVETPVLTWDFVYPIERWFQQVTREELEAGRRVMFYFEQNAVRSMAKRLEWVLKEFKPWTLPNNVEAEDRQQCIIDAVQGGHRVVIVPYRRVNEGLNLQSVIDTIVWTELAMNLFYFIQASQRAWRLGKEELVKILIPYYLGSAAHRQVRRLGERDGAAAAFAGEPAKGGLVQHVGADQTTLARLSAEIEAGELSELDLLVQERDDSAEIEANFVRRNQELAEALRRGRQWFGVEDRLSNRLATIIAAQHPDVWASTPELTYLPEVDLSELELPLTVEVKPEEETPEPQVDTHHGREEAPTAEVALPTTSVGGEQATAVPVVVHLPARERRGAVTFGDEEDIKRVRKLRASCPGRSRPKPKNSTTVKNIPAFVKVAALLGAQEEGPELILASLWDSAFSAGS
jgi:hypothetical protein